MDTVLPKPQGQLVVVRVDVILPNVHVRTLIVRVAEAPLPKQSSVCTCQGRDATPCGAVTPEHTHLKGLRLFCEYVHAK